MKILIKNGIVVTDEYEKRQNVFIENGIVSRIEENYSADADMVLDADGLYVLPGLVDAHCHLRDPGYEYKEDIVSGTRSAAMGGFTSVACMPNTNPVADNKTVIRYIIDKANREGVVHVFPIGAMTKGLRGEELAEIGEMKEAGIVGVSDDGRCVENSSVMKKVMLYARMFNLPVICHCEDSRLSEDGVMNEGALSTEMGLRGISKAAEEIMIARDVILSKRFDVPVHICHVSTVLGIEIIRYAKRTGVKVTAETCPHYFTLTERACAGYNTLAKVNPPLRNEEDVEAIIRGLCDGTIDIIATDHAPHHMDEKNVEFDKAANGMVGFETALPLSYTVLVKGGHISMRELVRKMSTKPAEILGIDKGRLIEGKMADITIFNPNVDYQIDISKFVSKSKNSPFHGFHVSGKVVATIVNGRIVVKDGELVV
ncbi:dihydroorotase [Thermoclostridium stercorarium subsp. thermolacticum DSM 2910]|uniref:Dihydroorotase n=1 Tax=Thermoclostridium stercorarium subsp. thermolacticum DSM 2910 TaxID=1121336 RepID=A0A1B1YF50_THEST|nr:dihydroorotase [Thermoclostridium stercorarium]ANW99363.1 dihydroorotase [Thermoclostridium stercorarium subsp. thermolacticum DSM 2910]UZQ85033.1 dihydroorotase [Thermoclostridium stercorarium]